VGGIVMRMGSEGFFRKYIQQSTRAGGGDGRQWGGGADGDGGG